MEKRLNWRESVLATLLLVNLPAFLFIYDRPSWTAIYCPSHKKKTQEKSEKRKSIWPSLKPIQNQ